MKQKDIALIIVIAFVSAVASLLLSSVFIGSPKKRTQQYEVVDKLTSQFDNPDTKYFNKDSVDPTRVIHIGNDSAADPFKVKR